MIYCLQLYVNFLSSFFQLAIIFRNLSFDADNMKYLASHDLVFR